jgi:hypothetical protein
MCEMVLVSLVGPGASTGYSERSPRASCDALKKLILQKNSQLVPVCPVVAQDTLEHLRSF